MRKHMTCKSFSGFFLKSILKTWPRFFAPKYLKAYPVGEPDGTVEPIQFLQAFTIPSECFWFPNYTFNPQDHILNFWSPVQIWNIRGPNWISEEPHYTFCQSKFLYTVNFFDHHYLILISLISEIHFM